MTFAPLRARFLSPIMICFAIVALLAGCGDDDATRPAPEPYSPPDDFVSIAADTFQMGTSPTHTVILTTYFWMAETEVTNAQYAELAQWAYDNGYCTATSSEVIDVLDGSTAILASLPKSGGVGFMTDIFEADMFYARPGYEELPVRYVSWRGAAAYCDWLSLREGRSRAYDHATWECNGGDPYEADGFRLPTEAEWEFACRAGTQTLFSTGDCLDAATEANYDGTQPAPGCPGGPFLDDIVPVGSYAPNGFGLYDMHGNLWEWCNDWYGDYAGDETDPVGPADGDYRIVRGGSWSYSAVHCQSGMRSWNPQTATIWLLGFRPVMSK